MRNSRLAPASHSEEIQINLTPLIDVVFVVLIMFIIVAPMLELDRVQLASAVPQKEKSTPLATETQPIAIHVHADNSIWFNQAKVSEQDLLALLKMARQHHTRAIPQLFHDKTAPFGTYQSIKNTVELAGFEQLDVILQP